MNKPIFTHPGRQLASRTTTMAAAPRTAPTPTGPASSAREILSGTIRTRTAGASLTTRTATAVATSRSSRVLPAFLALLALTLLGLDSCSYFYTSQIQGYVIDSNTSGGTTGIDNVTIWLYQTDPGTVNESDTVGPSGFFAKTATYTQGNNAGYFSNRVIWDNPAGSYGQEGDSTTLYVVLTQSNYKTVKYALPGVLSDSTNTIPDLKMVRATFTAPSVTGRIVDSSGNGVNGVRVVLTLYPTDPDTTIATNEDYVVTTNTPNGGVAGTYTFNNVTWKNVAATAVTDTHTVKIKVADNQYDGTADLDASLTSGSDITLATDVSVTRQPRTEFTAPLQGRIQRFNKTNSNYSGVQGVTVRVVYKIDATTNKTIETQTNANGAWNVNLTWKDLTPGNYDDGAADLTTLDTSIPEGDDGLLYTVTFESLPTSGSNFVQFSGQSAVSATTATFSNQEASSSKNPNYFPDGILDVQ